MKKSKKILSLFCAIAILISMLTIPAAAANYRYAYPEGDYIIASAADPSYVLDLSGGGTATYTYFQLYERNDTSAQIFTVKNMGDGWFLLVHKESGKVVNVENGVSKCGARLWLYPWDSTPAGQFRFFQVDGTDSYVIQNGISPGRILDVDNGHMGCYNGQRVQLWDAHDGVNAQWKLIPVSGDSASNDTTPQNKYFPAYKGYSLSVVTALKSLGVDSSFSFRTNIAGANGISSYTGSASQNLTMLNLLKRGQLIDPNGSSASAQDTDSFEKAWFPAPVMRITQIAYESYSHKNINVIDIAPGGRVFAPFTGKIVYKNARWGYVLLQSVNKVYYADGTLDYMTIGLMHDSDISDLYEGQIIPQGQAFYDAGGMGAGNPNAYAKHVEVGVFKGQISSPPNPSKLSNGEIFAYNAFFINNSKTTSVVNTGLMERGNYMTGGASSNWNGYWKML